MQRSQTIGIRKTLSLSAFFLAILLGLVFKPVSALAQAAFPGASFLKKSDVPWQITANSLTYIEKEAQYVAEGDVVISKGDQVLYAQKAIYNKEKGIAEVFGNVRLESAGDVLTGERGTFDLRNQTGEITNGRLFLKKNHYYLSGKVMEKLPGDTYRILDCLVTTCDGPYPAWSIRGSEVMVTLSQYGTVKDATFRIRDYPVMYLPYLIFPGKRERQTGFLPPRVGYSTRNGADLELPFYWAISEETDATFYQRYMSSRGYMQGLESRYLLDKNSKGIFMGDILSDAKEKDLNDPKDVEISPFPRNNTLRYWVRGMADQDLPYGLTAKMDVDLVSDQDYLREFQEGLSGYEARPELDKAFGRPVDSKYAPLRRSALKISRDRELYSLQALASYHQRPEHPSNDMTPQPLAGMDFTLPSERVMNLPIYFNLQTDYDYVWRESGARGQRFFMAPEFRFPMWLGRYLEVEPSLSYAVNAQWFDNEQGEADRQYQQAYQANVRMSTNLERSYEVDWRNARRLKHRIWPTLTYTYRVPQDEERHSPWFEPIDLEGRVNRVSLSLENFLDARMEDGKGNVTYEQWATLNLIQDYNLEEDRPLGLLTTILTLKPYPDIDFLGVTAWDHYQQGLASTFLSLDLTVNRAGGRKDTYAIDYSFAKGVSETLNFSLDFHVAYGFFVGSSLIKDLRLDQSVSESYWVRYMSQCWGIKILAERENDETAVALVFTLLGIGELRPW